MEGRKPRLSCHQCSKTYANRGGLNRHLRREHQAPDHSTMECDKCDLRYMYYTDLVWGDSVAHTLRIQLFASTNFCYFCEQDRKRKI